MPRQIITLKELSHYQQYNTISLVMGVLPDGGVIISLVVDGNTLLFTGRCDDGIQTKIEHVSISTNAS